MKGITSGTIGTITIDGESLPGLEALKRERNEARDKLATAELAMAQVRAVADEAHAEIVRNYGCNHPELADEGEECSGDDCIRCWFEEWKSRIPTGPESPLVEAVKAIVWAWHVGDHISERLDSLVALAPDSWKQPEGRKE